MDLRTARIWLIASLAALSFVACSSDGSLPRAFEDPPPQSDPDCPTNRGDERTIAELSNDARRKRGRPPFELDPQLSRVARKHTSEMIAAGDLVHSDPTELKRRITNWIELNENIGRGGDAEGIFRTFMNSDAHRRRILNQRYDHLGVGVLEDAAGSMWVTMVFESSKDPGTRLSRPTCY